MKVGVERLSEHSDDGNAAGLAQIGAVSSVSYRLCKAFRSR
jgi:hypothetical protein